MRNVWGKITCVCAAAVLALTGCAGKERTVVESLKDRAAIAAVSEHVYKTVQNANPVSPNIFCADPTAVEYEDRLYVYATNDTQQAENSDKNDYVHIKSFVVFSTDDMVNWAYHSRIEVGQIAPWIQNSWAPSVVSRKEKDGKTHFYLYFSNNGNGVGVLTAEHPLGPWSDPLGKPLIWQGMPGLQNCPAPFDPGVCIDENGTGWLSFGGGVPANGAKVHSNVPKIVRLGEDIPRICDAVAAPAQRPRNRRRGCGAGTARRCRPRRGDALRERRANRQCRYRDAGAEYVFARRRPGAGFLRYVQSGRDL